LTSTKLVGRSKKLHPFPIAAAHEVPMTETSNMEVDAVEVHRPPQHKPPPQAPRDDGTGAGANAKAKSPLKEGDKKRGNEENGKARNNGGGGEATKGDRGGDDDGEDGSSSAPPYDPDRVVPQLASAGITEADLRAATRVLEAVAALNSRGGKKGGNKKRPRSEGEDDSKGGDLTKSGDDGEDDEEEEDGLAQYRHKNLRPIRKALSKCFELHKRLVFGGKSEERHYTERVAERTLKRQKMAERTQQKEYIAKTQLRRGRIERLEKLKDDAKEEVVGKLKMLVPDGHVDTLEIEGGAQQLLLKDGASEGDGDAGGEEKKDDPVSLPKLRSCYVCKVRYRELHHFYDQLCPSCAELNYSKRHFSVPLDGKVAIVTGSRVKIGYQICLKLLRAGCEVVATTRFPNSAADTYRKEKDFEKWSGRLHVFGLDLRDVTGIEAFTRFLKMKYGDRGVDILINNACQTVRRPKGYYSPIVSKEQDIWNGADDKHRNMLGGCLEFERLRRRLVIDQAQQQHPSAGEARGLKDETPLLQIGLDHTTKQSGGDVIDATDEPSGTDHAVDEAKQAPPSSELATATKSASPIPFESTGVSHSAAMTQMVVLPEDVGVSPSILPPGASDVNGQQLDLRTTNSWLLKMDEVSTPEMMECMLINAIAPFVLNGRLKPLMTAPPGDPARPDRYIVNVSAMEGKFYRYKMPNHPHTNMAKAALNMLTRTSSEDLAKKHRIYMNSVDTGWINDENPLEKASKIAATNLFQTPIDEIDAAARVVDPIFVGVEADLERERDGTPREGKEGDAEGSKAIKKKKKQKQKHYLKKKEYGKFYKDYRETEW